MMCGRFLKLKLICYTKNKILSETLWKNTLEILIHVK